MTRIIAGQFRGRRLALPADQRVRPTADRVREAWLSIVARWIPAGQILDLFAGSGALGIEALSRGAAGATFVELNPASVEAISKNLTALDLNDRSEVHKRDAIRFLRQYAGPRFDVAFADPPYGHPAAREVAERFAAAPFATVLGVEHAGREMLPDGDTRRYGETAITFYYAL